MAGVLLENIDYGGGLVAYGVRVGKVYDASLYWYGVSSGERHGLGLIGIGRSDNGRDMLLPSLDWDRDICAYTLGGEYFRDSACPKISIASNGVINVSGDMAVFNHNYVYPSLRILGLPLGKHCASSRAYTSKLRARDYDTYDSRLHRSAGVSGLTDSDTAKGEYGYVDLPHGSLFLFDNYNGVAPTFCSLLAIRNMNIKGVHLRKGQDDPRSGYWHDFVYDPPPEGNAPTFYVPNNQSSQHQATFFMRNLNSQVQIGNDLYYLFMVSVDYPTSSGSGNMWTYFESPWYEVQNYDGESGSMYILDEWVTIHKPTSV